MCIYFAILIFMFSSTPKEFFCMSFYPRDECQGPRSETDSPLTHLTESQFFPKVKQPPFLESQVLFEIHSL